MKKAVIITLCIATCICLAMALCACNSDFIVNRYNQLTNPTDEVDIDEMTPTVGLSYKRVLFTYVVKGIGDAKDRDIVIPMVYNSLPVVGIGVNAFGGSNITSVSIPSSVINIASTAFNDCNDLESFAVSKYSTRYYAEGNCVILKGKDSSTVVCGCNKSVIPEDPTIPEIGDHAFTNCKKLHTFTIPATITAIGDSAFAGCDKLVEVCNKSNLEIVAGSADHGYVATNAYRVISDESQSKVRVDGDMVLVDIDGGCSLVGYYGKTTSLTLPQNLTEISSKAFIYSENLENVTLPKRLTTLRSNAFEDCTSLKSITIGKNITNIEKFTFIDCKNLESVSLPTGMESIVDGMFYGCSKLQNVDVPASVTYIGEWAFRDCTSLISLYISKNVTMLGHFAFVGCTALQSVEFEDPEDWYRLDAKYENYSTWQNRENGEHIRDGELSNSSWNAIYLRNDYGNDDFYWYK